MKIIRKNKLKNILAILVVVLFLNLPFISALEISNVRAEEVTGTSAVIKWSTDEPADSFVSSGSEKGTLQKVGDANPVVEHEITLNSLLAEKTYYYQVESNDLINDNNGTLYSFSTPAPDTTPPEIKVELPALVAGSKVDLSGTTEIGAIINLYVNGDLAGSTVPTAGQNGGFQFTTIILQANQANQIRLEAIDQAGNKATKEGSIVSDTLKPRIELAKIPTIILDHSFALKGNISENSSFEIFVSNKSVATGTGMSLEQTLTLSEGKNVLKIVAKDTAGWETIKEVEIESDTKAPEVKATLEKGNEYYQGRAETNINGETEPGATVYLYVYRPLGYEFKPSFDKARAKVTANEKGEFTFKEVDFETEPLSLEKMAPKLVPQGLQELSIFPLQQVAEQQQFTYYVYIIAEDKSGKTAYWQSTLTINTCYSSNWDFDVQSLAQFQAPLRLNPQLVDEGREIVSAVFNLSYRGKGVPKLDLVTGRELESAYQIVDVTFDRACTQSMTKSEDFKLGCTLLPQAPKAVSNGNKNAWYITYNLHRGDELSQKKEDFWNEFKKRQVVFPLKIRVGYQERGANGVLSQTKYQTSCADLSYFVDIPLDSKDMLPDFLVDEGLDSIKYTLDKIETVLPYLEKAIFVSGVGCRFSFLGRIAARYARLVVSYAEAILTKGNDEGKKCPSPSEQYNYHLRSTIGNWQALKDSGVDLGKMPEGWATKILEDRCPVTASFWKMEAALDQAYKWTCDRIFCRTVPAGWTATKNKEEVDTVIQKQLQCAVTSRGIPLQLVENCQDFIKKDVTNPSSKVAEKIKNEGAFPCYRNNDKLYIVTSKQSSEQGLIRLELAHDFGMTLQEAQKYVGSTDLLAYRPPGSESFIVGKDQVCAAACKSKSGYKADKTKGVSNYYKSPSGAKYEVGNYGCYREKIDGATGNIILYDKSNQPLKSSFYSAGYTADCFIDVDQEGEPKKLADGETGLLQCVCTTDAKELTPPGPREAVKEENGVAEEWDYREDAIFKESKNKAGTNYPTWRYYTGRDFSSAFGADSLTDALAPDDKKQAHQVDPHTYVGTFQTVCLSGIRANLVMLQAILQGMRSCIEEAKITGLHDAGACKTLFSQQVCGLIYKAIASFAHSCTPTNFDDVGKGGAVEDVGALMKAGIGSIPVAMQSSIDDIKKDYGNAKLNEYFATGAQGFTQSICLAAFGYDWPMGMDLMTDATYAFTTKTTAMALPATRELATYNPQTGNAIFNYEIGALILPGCRIKSYDVYLKCVGQDDLGRPGVQCGSQGCDCSHADKNSAFEGKKIKYLDGGRSLTPSQPGSLISVPIPSPQKVDSPFRYDHVVIELRWDQFQDPTQCFDEGYRDGKFYFPITDVSPPREAVCQVQPTTGKYFCPEIVSMFGGEAGSYLEDPYISCYDKNTDSYVSCKTPNLFVKGDVIKVKTHVQSNGKGQCLKMTVSGLGSVDKPYAPLQLYENLPGAFSPEMNLGSVDKGLFGGTSNTLTLTQDSDSGCNYNVQYLNVPSTPIGSQPVYRFIYSRDNNGLYRVTLPTGVVPDAPFQVGTGNVLAKTGTEVFSSAELQKVQFNMEGLKVKNLIGAPSGGKNVCTYQIVSKAGSSYAPNQKSISVTAELLQPDVNGQCLNANLPVKAGAFGKTKHTEQIILQSEPFVSQVASQMHQEFMKNNCQFVQSNAKTVINREPLRNDLEDALALYYSTACYVLEGKDKWSTTYKDPICINLNIFFKRYYPILNKYGDAYLSEVTSTAEYLKIYQYFNEINKKVNCVSVPPDAAPATNAITKTTCGFSETLPTFESFKPKDWETYICREPIGAELVSTSTLPSPSSKPQCWSRGMYSNEEIAQKNNLFFGCPEKLYCCPPKLG